MPGYQGRYEVSNLGQVKSLPRTTIRSNGRPKPVAERLLQVNPNSRGYIKVNLCSGTGKSSMRFVHQLIALAFLGPYPAGQCVLHGPGGRLDNSLSNLSYGTPADNNGRDRLRDGTLPRGTRHGNSKLTERDVFTIRSRVATGERVIDLAQEYGVSRWTIYDSRARTWAWLEGSPKPSPSACLN